MSWSCNKIRYKLINRNCRGSPNFFLQFRDIQARFELSQGWSLSYFTRGHQQWSQNHRSDDSKIFPPSSALEVRSCPRSSNPLTTTLERLSLLRSEMDYVWCVYILLSRREVVWYGRGWPNMHGRENFFLLCRDSNSDLVHQFPII